MQMNTPLSLQSLDTITDTDINHSDFENIKTYVDDSNFKRRLVRHVPTGELYFYEFVEEIDWVKGGHDPQYRTYIPVDDENRADEVNMLDRFQIHTIVPRLINDWDAGGARVTKWVK